MSSFGLPIEETAAIELSDEATISVLRAAAFDDLEAAMFSSNVATRGEGSGDSKVGKSISDCECFGLWLNWCFDG